MFHNTNSTAARNGLAAAAELLEVRRESPLSKRRYSIQGSNEDDATDDAWPTAKSPNQTSISAGTTMPAPTTSTSAKDSISKLPLQDPALIAAIRFVESMRVDSPADTNNRNVTPSSPTAEANIMCGAILSPVLTLPASLPVTDDPVAVLSSPLFELPGPLTLDISKTPFVLPPAAVEKILPQNGVLPPDESVTPLVVPDSPDEEDDGVLKSPVIALKDIYTDAGSSVYGEGGEEYSSSSSSSTDEDYENCDDDAFAFIERQQRRLQQQLEELQQSMTPLESKQRKLRQHQNLNYSNVLNALAPAADSSESSQIQPRRKRGRPRLNPYLLPPSHPKYQPPPNLLPSSTSESSHGPIKVKLRVPVPPSVSTNAQPSLLSATTPVTNPSADLGVEEEHKSNSLEGFANQPLSPPQSLSDDGAQKGSTTPPSITLSSAEPSGSLARTKQVDAAALPADGAQPVKKRGRGRPRKFTVPILDASGEAMSYYQLQKEKKRLMMLERANGQVKDETATVRAVAVAAEVAEARGRLRRNSRRLGGFPERTRSDMSAGGTGSNISSTGVNSPQKSESDHEYHFMDAKGGSEVAETEESACLPSSEEFPVEEASQKGDVAATAVPTPAADEVFDNETAGKRNLTEVPLATVSLESIGTPKGKKPTVRSDGKKRRKISKTAAPHVVVHSSDTDVVEPSEKLDAAAGHGRMLDNAQMNVEVEHATIAVNIAISNLGDAKAKIVEDYESEDVIETAEMVEADKSTGLIDVDEDVEATSGETLSPESIELHRQLQEKLQRHSVRLAEDGVRRFREDAEPAHNTQKEASISTVGLNPAVVLTTILTISVANAKRRLQQLTLNTSAAIPNPCEEAQQSKALTTPVAAAIPVSPPTGSNSSIAVLMMNLPYPANPPPSCRRRLKLGLLSIVPAGRSDRRFVCPSCGKDYKNANGVKYHLNKFHPEGVGIPTILYAGAAEESESRSEREEDSGVFVEDEVYNGDSAIPSNVDATTVNVKPTDFECFLEGCEKVFRSVNGLRYHVKNTHKALLVEAEHRNIFVDYEIPPEIAMSFGVHAARSRPKFSRNGAGSSASKLKHDGSSAIATVVTAAEAASAPASDAQTCPAPARIPKSEGSGSNRKRKLADEDVGDEDGDVDVEEVIDEHTRVTDGEGDGDVAASPDHRDDEHDYMDETPNARKLSKDSVYGGRHSKRRAVLAAAAAAVAAAAAREDESSKIRRRSSRVFVGR
ncbi:hypothetical protein HDU82_002743 [Entophlyctis luteolus]|nr:hypothetical protein HDU82_002743 [Entophlyctis luteolus]